MPDEMKSERITTMMAPSDVTALDDWAFANRIRSRGEAIRRLIAIGLAAQPLLSDLVRDLSRPPFDADPEIRALAEKLREIL